MHPHKKIYTAIVILTGLILFYSLFSYASFMVKDGFNFLLNWHIMASMLPVLVGIIAIIIFAATNFKRSGLLRIYMCYNIFFYPFFLLEVRMRMNYASGFDANLFSNWNFLLHFLTFTILMICSCTGLWLLSGRRKPVLNYITIGTETIAEFSPVKASLRFVNRLTDILLIIFMLYIELIENHWIRNLFRNTGSGTLLLLEFVVTLYYYMVLEGIFNTTAGKCITSTMILNDTGRKPAISAILGRTLCRYIPFEAFSFFGGNSRGWHDSMSGTYVVKSMDESDMASTISNELN